MGQPFHAGWGWREASLWQSSQLWAGTLCPYCTREDLRDGMKWQERPELAAGQRAKPPWPGRELVRWPELGQQEEGGYHGRQEPGPEGGDCVGEGQDPILRDTGGRRSGMSLQALLDARCCCGSEPRGPQSVVPRRAACLLDMQMFKPHVGTDESETLGQAQRCVPTNLPVPRD